jgi:hypothetical protein
MVTAQTVIPRSWLATTSSRWIGRAAGWTGGPSAADYGGGRLDLHPVRLCLGSRGYILDVKAGGGQLGEWETISNSWWVATIRGQRTSTCSAGARRVRVVVAAFKGMEDSRKGFRAPRIWPIKAATVHVERGRNPGLRSMGDFAKRRGISRNASLAEVVRSEVR